MNDNNGMDWSQRIRINPEKNRRSMVTVVIVVIASALSCGIGVYFGMFGSIILAGR